MDVLDSMEASVLHLPKFNRGGDGDPNWEDNCPWKVALDYSYLRLDVGSDMTQYAQPLGYIRCGRRYTCALAG